MTEEIHIDDDGVETTGVGPAGASAAAISLFCVHGSFGAVAASGFLTAQLCKNATSKCKLNTTNSVMCWIARELCFHAYSVFVGSLLVCV